MAETDDRAAARKRRRILFVQRYLLNPPTRLAVRAGLLPRYVLVETAGRRSGKRRHTPVGMHIEGSTGWVVSEQGRHSGYVRNIEANPDVRVCIRRRWHPARAQVLPDDDVEARLAVFNRASHTRAIRLFGTAPQTLRFDFPTPPRPGPGAERG